MTSVNTRPMSEPTIGVLILNRDGRDWLPTVYDSIRRDVYPYVRVYLVDNGSNDESIKTTLDNYPEVTIIRLPQNLGYCMAYHLAMPYAFADRCGWVIWANNDIKVERGCMEQLALAAQSDPRIGVVGPAFLKWEGEGPNYYMLGNHPTLCSAMKSCSAKPVDVEWVEGSFLMVSRQCVQSVGPLDPNLFMYWEEADFCRRARYRGWRVVLAPSALARHYAGGSQSNQETRAMAKSLQSRNYYIYKMANPSSGFIRNVLDAAHLLLVHMKQCMIEKPSMAFFHLQVFAGVLANISTLYRKWARDRAGGHPPELKDGMLPVAPEIICGKSAGQSILRHGRATSL
jgi:GT2 family glycosyltransferase